MKTLRASSLSNLKRAIAHASPSQLSELTLYIRDRIPEAKWRELSDVKAGDSLYSHKLGNTYALQAWRVIRVRPRLKRIVMRVDGVSREYNKYALVQWAINKTPHPDVVAKILAQE